MMSKLKTDYSFWTKYKKFAGNEILLYVIMVVGIVSAIVIISYLQAK
jgi:cell division protein FtsL